jgi:hypothetical protein
MYDHKSHFGQQPHFGHFYKCMSIHFARIWSYKNDHTIARLYHLKCGQENVIKHSAFCGSANGGCCISGKGVMRNERAFWKVKCLQRQAFCFLKCPQYFFFSVIPNWYLLGIMIKKVRNVSHLHHATPLCRGHSPNNGLAANCPTHNLPPQTLMYIFLIYTQRCFMSWSWHCCGFSGSTEQQSSSSKSNPFDHKQYK